MFLFSIAFAKILAKILAGNSFEMLACVCAEFSVGIVAKIPAGISAGISAEILDAFVIDVGKNHQKLIQDGSQNGTKIDAKWYP